MEEPKQNNDPLLFKGKFMDGFIVLEREIQSGIIKFFQSHVKPFNKKGQYRALTSYKNARIEDFWNHCVFEDVEMSFMFRQKLKAYDFIIMSIDAKVYNLINDGGNKSILKLIANLQKARNIMAHTLLVVSHDSPNKVYSVKNKTSKVTFKPDFLFNEKVVTYKTKTTEHVFDENVCNDMYTQLEYTIGIIGSINHWYSLLNKKHPSLDKKEPLLEFIKPHFAKIKSLNNKGVYAFLKNYEKEDEASKKRQQEGEEKRRKGKEEKLKRTAEYEERQAKNKENKTLDNNIK